MFLSIWEDIMQKKMQYTLISGFLLLMLISAGCVERKLTINTVPSGAEVMLNDEHIGTSPVTTNFKWYGDYKVRIRKPGWATLDTHRKLKGPWYDYFPFDFFAQVINPKRIVDSYEWTFELPEKTQIPEKELLDKAQALKSQVN
jgi:hypothetical protein